MSTPTPPNDPSAGDKLPGEAELAALYRRLPRREPGPALDAAVRQAAAQAIGVDPAPLRVERRMSARESGDWVHPKPLSAIRARAIPSIEAAARSRPRRVPHWLVAVGSAASLVLVAGLAWHMRSTPTAAPLQGEAATPEATVAAPAAGQAADRPAAVAAPAPRAAEPQAAARREAMAASKPSPAAEFAAPPPAPLPPRAAAPAAKAQVRLQAASAMRREAPAPTADALVQAAPATAASVATPAAELARIEQLFAQGDAREAQQRLLDFHRAHPQWPLPPELQAKLPKP
jgi:hypothetical protein